MVDARQCKRQRWLAEPVPLTSTFQGARESLAGIVKNVTQALLPLVPLLVEVPSLAHHAKLAWPVVRGRLPLPLAFVGCPQLKSNTGHKKTILKLSSAGAERHGTTSVPENWESPVPRREVLRSWGATTCTILGVALGHPDLSCATPANGDMPGSPEAFGSKQYTQRSYDRAAESYDDLDGGWAAAALGIEGLRSALLAGAHGRVLEVGVGTGLNLPCYRRDLVSRLDAIDLSPGMLNQARKKGAALAMDGILSLREMDVEALSFPDKTFDTVVDTFSLCVFNDPVASLREMARVCKPGGKVLLLENSKSEFAPLAAYQDATAEAAARAGKGCYWNQDVVMLAQQAGLKVLRTQSVAGGLFRSLECAPVL